MNVYFHSDFIVITLAVVFFRSPTSALVDQRPPLRAQHDIEHHVPEERTPLLSRRGRLQRRQRRLHGLHCTANPHLRNPLVREPIRCTYPIPFLCRLANTSRPPRGQHPSSSTPTSPTALSQTRSASPTNPLRPPPHLRSLPSSPQPATTASQRR